MNTMLMSIRHRKVVAKTTQKPVASPAVITDELAAKMKTLAKFSLRRRSVASYGSEWKMWKAWAESTGNSALPAHPDAVAAWLASLSDTRKFATLKHYLATICARHTRQQLDLNRDAVSIRAVMDGHRQTRGTGQRKAEALTTDKLRLVLGKLTDKTADVRDRAILLLGVTTGLRRSELTCLRWLTMADGTGVIERKPEGMLITLAAAKTGGGEAQEVTCANKAAIAVIESWVKLAGVEPGTLLFRSVDRHGNIGASMTDKALADMVKKRVGAAGLDASAFSGHSLRSGMLQSGAAAGADKRKLMRQARHKTESVTNGYLKAASVWADDVSGLIDV